jgi:hypothetical protein
MEIKQTIESFRIGCIGSAGRGLDGAKYNADVYKKMVVVATELIKKSIPKKADETVVRLKICSGASAWADHVAIDVWKYFLNMFKNQDQIPKPALDLYLPCYIKDGKFVDGDLNKQSCAYALNNYHGAFSKAIGRNTIAEIVEAQKLGATLHFVKGGFKARNTPVAEHSRHLMIAFTWGDKENEPKDGGTLDTWKKCAKTTRKIHVPLSKLVEN